MFKSKFSLLGIAALSLTLVHCRTVNSADQDSGLQNIESKTTLKELTKTSVIVVLSSLGSPLSSAKCQGFQIQLIPLANMVKLSACRADKNVKMDILLNEDEKVTMLNFLDNYTVSPVPESAFTTPCPFHAPAPVEPTTVELIPGGGGYEASAIGEQGSERYLDSVWACQGNDIQGVLEFPENENFHKDFLDYVTKLANR